MPLRTIGFALLILLAACAKTPVTADKGQESVEWAGHIFHEVRNLKELPAGVQSALGVGKSGLDGIADHGGKYNPTDVILSDLPMRRFLFAGLTVTRLWLQSNTAGRDGDWMSFSLITPTRRRRWCYSSPLRPFELWLTASGPPRIQTETLPNFRSNPGNCHFFMLKLIHYPLNGSGSV